jgi:hypothetical protein
MQYYTTPPFFSFFATVLDSTKLFQQLVIVLHKPIKLSQYTSSNLKAIYIDVRTPTHPSLLTTKLFSSNHDHKVCNYIFPYDD